MKLSYKKYNKYENGDKNVRGEQENDLPTQVYLI